MALDQEKTYSFDEVEELELNAKGALLEEIIRQSVNATPKSLQHLAEAHAYLIAPATSHGSIG